MTAPRPLDQLQRWMLAAITDPAGVAHGASHGVAHGVAQVAPPSIDEIIEPSRQQTAAERLAVYGNAYFARLLEVLRDLFPCVRYAVGDDLFDQFAIGYLAAYPPASYTLHHLADHFAEHLEATRPAGDDWATFVVELAQLEYGIDQVFDGPGPEEVPPPEPSQLATGQIALVPGFRLLAFQFPVSTYFTAWKAGAIPAWPAKSRQFIALMRRDYVVRRYELSPTQHELLSQLAAGQSLDASLAAIATDAASLDDLAANVRRWFAFWAAEKFFVGR